MAGKVELEVFSPEEHQPWLDAAIHQGMVYNDNIKTSLVYIIKGETHKGLLPVALLRVLENQEFFEPHADVFPWASPRNIYEGAKEVVEFLNKTKHVLIVAGEGSPHKLWSTLARDKIVREVGYLDGDNGKRFLYQGMK